MQLPLGVWLMVPLLLAGFLVHRSEPEPGEVLFAVRGDEIVLAGTAADLDERLRVVDAVRSRAPGRRITDMLTADSGRRIPVEPGQVGALVAVVLDTDFTGVIHDGRLTATARVADPASAGALSDAVRDVAGALRVDEDFIIR